MCGRTLLLARAESSSRTEQQPSLLRVKVLRFADGHLELRKSHKLNQSGAGPQLPEARNPNDSDLLDWFLRDLKASLEQGGGIWQANSDY